MTGSDHFRKTGIDWRVILKLVIRKCEGGNSIHVSHGPAQCCAVANMLMTIRLGIPL
jgi:hypothetical protein